MKITQALRDYLHAHGYKGVDGRSIYDAPEADVQRVAAMQLSTGLLSTEKLAELQKAAPSIPRGDPNRSPSPYDVLMEAAKHSGAGQVPQLGDDAVEEQRLDTKAAKLTAAQAANFGCFLKFTAHRAGVKQSPLTGEETRHLMESFKSERWCGQSGKDFSKAFAAHDAADLVLGGNYHAPARKDLLDDSISGGSEISPYYFDDLLVTYPQLNGELAPMVQVVNIARGSSVQGGALGNPSVVWGTAEGTAINAFDTTALVTDISASIKSVTCAVQVGRDFLEDAPMDVGAQLAQNIVEAFAAALDSVIANGDGTSQPQGFFNASGTVAVTAAVPNGPQVLGDYEGLMFGVGKQYRTPNMRTAFIANDTTYRRARGMPRGANDAQRINGMTYQDYMLMGAPFKIQNDIPNTKAAFVCLSRYRLWRRLGTRIEWHTQGQTLGLKNEALLIVRARYGGKLVDGNAAAICTQMAS